MVSRTARAWTNGMMASAMRQAARKPSPTYMIGSIMNYASGRKRHSRGATCHASRSSSSPVPAQPEPNQAEASRSERIPGRLRREFEVADIGAEPHADAGANRNHHDAVRGQYRHPQPAHEIRRAVDAAEALVHRLRRRQIVDQHHGAGPFAADVPTERGTLPIDPQIAGVLGVQRAFAVTQPADESAAGFLAEDVAVVQAPLAHRPLDDLRQAARNPAEELVTRVYQLMGGKPGVGGLRRRLSGRRRGTQSRREESQAGNANERAHECSIGSRNPASHRKHRAAGWMRIRHSSSPTMAPARLRRKPVMPSAPLAAAGGGGRLNARVDRSRPRRSPAPRRDPRRPGTRALEIRPRSVR